MIDNFRIDNFSAGPTRLPDAALLRMQQECLNWQGHGHAAFEFSHRHADFIELLEQTKEDLRALLAISNDYEILFLQGGATLQFSTLVMNLLADEQQHASYAITGSWSKKAAQHAEAYCQVQYACHQPDARTLDMNKWQIEQKSQYLHYCMNETISGLESYEIPSCSVPLVVDMSSTLLSRPFDVSRFGLIYAGAQKNIGPSGLTLVIIHRDLLNTKVSKYLPPTLNYQLQAEATSLLNTPPASAIYMTGLVFRWLLDIGGLKQMAKINATKAQLLYDTVDASELYSNIIDRKYRSHMNVTFTVGDGDRLLADFLAEAQKAQLLGLKGHKSIGGARASIYNAVPLESVQRLVAFMRDFESRY